MTHAAGIVPMLAVADAAAALDFYVRGFGGEVVEKMCDADGRVAHAEVRIGDARFMVNDEYPDHGAVSPARLGGSPVLLLLTCGNVDTALERALAAGATLDRPVQDGVVRNAKLRDPAGHRWMLAEPARRFR